MIGVESQNALLIQIVQPPLHVEMKNVSILVIVHPMLFVQPEVIVDIVNVRRATLEIHTLVDVEKVRVVKQIIGICINHLVKYLENS